MPAAQVDVRIQDTLLIRLAEARAQTDKLFDIVHSDALYERPIPERHRIVFYLGHLEAFDWNLLRDRIPGLKPFDSQFDQLFAFGIDPVGGGLPSDRPTDWPSVQEVRRYNNRIREALEAALESIASWDLESGGGYSAKVLLNVAIEHRLMHAETLAYMLHQLPLDRKDRQANAPVANAHPVDFGMVEIPSGSTVLGLSRDDAAFGWDNEYDAHLVAVPTFTIDRYKVTNAQYLEFMNAGGYNDRSLWPEAGWKWKEEEDIRQPVFWKRRNRRWYYRTMFDELPLPLDWPAYVSHAEASAYARWAGKALPAEAQWHRAAYGTPDGSERPQPWGTEPPGAMHGYLDFQRWDPAPVNAFPRGRSAFGVEGLIANGWEWTSSIFGPFEGFQPFPFYPGYSANFFDGKHYVLKGGSTRTDASMLRRSYRNWFQPHYQYVYAGFRCVSA
ncbi:MAG TPA: SUMF1/EgtB/PvdO family nonheme iron enzyme [Bryobacteraceae bacterium]|nr:SUMF1/EgtB/PvdO family nonheme iron enzyme [Bryobacteraceae bacterium]